MSGPKVVRIVTREEIIATCKDILAQLEVEIRRWEKIGTRNELLSDDEIDATRLVAAPGLFLDEVLRLGEGVRLDDFEAVHLG